LGWKKHIDDGFDSPADSNDVGMMNQKQETV